MFCRIAVFERRSTICREEIEVTAMKKTVFQSPKNILVIQQRQLGDVTVTTPVFEQVKKTFPEAKLTFLTEEKCVPLVQHDPYLDEIITFPKKKGFWAQLAFYFGLKNRNFDVAADLQQLPRCQLASFFSRAKYRLTFAPRHAYRKLLYTHCAVPENTDSDYTAFSKARIFSPLGLEPIDLKPKLYVLDQEKEEAKQILQTLGIAEGDTFITLDATHKHPKRRWQHYEELVREILIRYPAFKFFVIRAPGEDGQVRHLLDIDRKRMVMPEKPLTLRQTMACMSFAGFHIGNTSAPEHMALALNVPALIILAETGSFWHYDPKNPPKGTARQAEVRLSDEEYQAYLHNLALYKQGRNENFQPVEFPLINCISVEKALCRFKELVLDPYYK